MEIVIAAAQSAWRLLMDASVYILFGLMVSGLLKIFLSPGIIARHLVKGRFLSVVKAALLGIPLPLCSCGVLPAAVGLRKQGANSGATTAFLISTPESGVDSIAVTYAMMDPLMTIARPASAFVSATAAGIAQNLLEPPANPDREFVPDRICPVDGCCDGIDCDPEVHRRHHGLGEKVWAGVRYAVADVWADMAGWFLLGVLIAGLITVLIPEDVFSRYLGGGMPSMLLMLAAGIPLYICATASTPIAAAMVLKGVSPGAALVFLLVGPATNITSLTVLLGVLGKRATAVYLTTIAVVAVAAGLIVDRIYIQLGLDVHAVMGRAGEIIPSGLQLAGALVLLVISVRPVYQTFKGWFGSSRKQIPATPEYDRPALDSGKPACSCLPSSDPNRADTGHPRGCTP